jgi:UDP-GlcNAc:undecaprenyl-phosphate GlcNAc-1-phosphate transferase
MPDFIIDFLKAVGIYDPGDWGWVTIVLTFLIGVVVAWWFTPRTLRYSLQVGWADEPNARRVNKEPLPNAGGLAIFCAVILAVLAVTLLRRVIITGVQLQILAILLGGSLVMLAGFIDDQHGLPPLFRLGVQLIAALLLVGTGIRLNVTFGGGAADFLSGLFTVIWIVAITNAINLIDGVDGLAGGVSFITAMSLMGVSAQFSSRAAATVVLAALAGAALGFLRHNFPPSKIIMGDSGAYFFGFVLAASALLGNLKFTTVFALGPAVAFLLLVFLLPVLDTLQVVFRRLLKRQNPLSSPGKDHLHHVLMSHGYSQRRTTLILWAITLATNILAMWLQDMEWPVIVTTAVGTVLLLGFVVWRRLRAHRKFKARGDASPESSAAAHP